MGIFTFIRRHQIAVVAMCLAASRVAVVVALPASSVDNAFEDDAFYYFAIARNISHGLGSTFNGIDLTNGYHPLWLCLLVPIFWSLPSTPAALTGVTVVAAILMLVAAASLDRIRPMLGGAKFTLSVTPLVLVGSVGPSLWFNGMETGLLLTCMILLGEQYVRSQGFRLDLLAMRDQLTIGALVTLCILARLDSAIVLGGLFLWLCLGPPKAERWDINFALQTASIPFVTLTSYLVLNQAIFGTWTPVSGQAKALGDGGNANTLVQFLASPPLFDRNTWLGAVAIIVALSMIYARRKVNGTVSHALIFGAIVIVGGFLTMTYYAINSSWSLWPWYFYTSPLGLAFTLPALFAAIRISRNVARLLALVTMVGMLSASIMWAQLSLGGQRGQAFVRDAAKVATMVDAIPVNGPAAIGDRAGALGFNMQRPIVHLEGLVGPASYLEALRNADVASFLHDRGVGLYIRVDAFAGAPEPTAGTGCRSFPEPNQGRGPKVRITVCDQDLVLDHPLADGTSYRVWRYRAEINH